MKRIGILIVTCLLLVEVFSQSDDAIRFGNGLKLDHSGGKYGIKNSKDKTKLKTEYDSIGIYGNLAQSVIVKKNGGYGLYDIYNFKFLIPVGCEIMYFVVKENKDYPVIVYKQKGKYGVMGIKGDKVLAPLYDEIIHNLDTWRYVVKKGGKYGLYRSGKPASVVFKPQFDKVELLEKQQDKITLKVKKEDKYGIVTCKNDYLEARYDDIKHYYGECGYEVFIIENEGKYGILSYSNHVTIPAEYDRIEPLNHGWAVGHKKGEFVVFENEAVINKKYICDKAVLKKQEGDFFYFELMTGDSSMEIEVKTITKIRK